MSKKKISGLTWIAVFFTIGSVLAGVYFNNVSEGYALYYGLPTRSSFIGGIAALVCAIGFFLGLCGLIVEIKRRNWQGMIICFICVFFSLFFIGLCLPPLGCAREGARRISCASNLKQIYFSLEQYATDYSGYFPPENGAAGLEYLRRNDYLTDYGVYICPASLTTKGQDNQPLTEDNMDYVYVGGLNQKSAPDTPILYDKPNNHEFFGNVAYVNGRVEGISDKNWREKIKK